MTFVGVASRDSEDAMRAFVDARGVGAFPHVNDVDGAIWRDYGVSYQPSFVFIAADGSTESFGALDQAEIQDVIDRLF